VVRGWGGAGVLVLQQTTERSCERTSGAPSSWEQLHPQQPPGTHLLLLVVKVHEPVLLQVLMGHHQQPLPGLGLHKVGWACVR